MKKLILLSVISLFVLSTPVFAEIGAQTYSGNSTQSFREQQVFIDCYNGSGSDISSNWVVILDTTVANIASGSTLGTYINTTTTASDCRILGVTDQTISNGKVGRVCVRGPHKVFITALATNAAVGATLATTTTAGSAQTTSVITPGADFGFLLDNRVISSASPGFSSGDGTSNYWMWITK